MTKFFDKLLENQINKTKPVVLLIKWKYTKSKKIAWIYNTYPSLPYRQYTISPSRRLQSKQCTTWMRRPPIRSMLACLPRIHQSKQYVHNGAMLSSQLSHTLFATLLHAELWVKKHQSVFLSLLLLLARSLAAQIRAHVFTVRFLTARWLPMQCAAVFVALT